MSKFDGSWFGRLAGPVLGAVLWAGPAFAAEPEPAGFSVPEALSVSLGWKPLPEGNYEPYRTGSVFTVGSEPSQWSAAREQAGVWAAATPALEEQPANYLMRKLARIEALVLGATDPNVLAELKAERKALGESARALRAKKSADGSDWQLRNTAEQLQQLDKTLGQWLADSPAERLAVFREEMDSYRPADRAQIAARYGGEEKLAELIKLVKEHARLNAAFQAAQQDTSLPEAEHKLAVRKAGGALGYFYGFNGDNREWQVAMQDPELTGEFGGEDRMDYRSISVPDLLAWVDEAAAEKLLGEVYQLPVEVQLDAGSRTGGLARRLVLEGKLTPKRVPWSLISWRSSTVNAEAAGELVVLFDALKKQFPEMTEKKTGGSDWNRNRALSALAYALAITGRMDEAVAMLGVEGVNDSGLPYHARMTQEVAVAAWDLAMRVAASGKKTDGWDALINLAGLAGRSSELTVFAAKQADEAPKDSEPARIWQTRHAWALISEEKIDEGLALLAKCLESRPAAKEKAWAEEWPRSVERLFNLAKVLARPALEKEWSDKLTVEFQNPASEVWAQGESLFGTYAAGQLKAGNFALIEGILRGRLTVQPKARARGGIRVESEDGEEESRVDLQEVTMQLADVMARQGNHAGVLALLAESPNWQQTDLSQYLNRGSGGRGWRPLALVVAESLQASGRGEEAAAILEAYLIDNSGYDPAYAAYTKLRGDKAVPFLEKLWAADHYEERPLIWLASLQLAAGKVAEAETTVKRAIATDPSDGEQPKGDRMRAYAVLREIELAKGDTKQAEFFAGVIAAIRRSEDADDIAQAGLIDRAIKEYELALDSFSDAYCIQSRLARRLAEENRLPEAMEHYKRAFELMPDSFGRVESHCFGCEQAFAGEDAQAVAERVFKEMAAKPDAKPQVQYLLGYLRMEQERWEEAAEYYSKAVAADPEYLNAWRKLAEVLPNTLRPRAEQDRVAFRLLALDPAGKHGSAGEERVRDIPALWKAYAAARDNGPTVPEKLFPLGDKAKKAKPKNNGYMDHLMDSAKARTPAERLARHDVLENITRMLDGVYQWQTSVQ
jgi:tetratricopeptide (TPR) repeat protein